MIESVSTLFPGPYLQELFCVKFTSTIVMDIFITNILQLIFQSNEKTLQTKDIEIIVENLQLLLNNKFGALLRA